MSNDQLFAIVTAIMLSGYSGKGGFSEEQLGFAAIEARQIITHTTGQEMGEIIQSNTDAGRDADL